MVTRKRIYDPVPTQYSAKRALICLQTVELHSTILTLDILQLKDGVDTRSYYATKTFTPILDFMSCCSSYEDV